MPDIYYAYGNNLYELGLDDNRTVMHEQRFMLSNNILDPKVYQVTKVTDLNPSGVIKYSIKQDELDNKRDNVELQICDYYTDSGDQKTETIQKPQMMITKSQIRWLTLNDDGELEPLYDKSKQYLYLGMNSYFEYKLPYQDLKSEWNLSVYDRKNELSDEDKTYYEGLMKITVMDNVTYKYKVMQEEIFGPIMPILTYDSLDDLIRKINSMPHPLALYFFTRDKAAARKVTSQCQFGGGCINDTIIHLATSEMPFGGFGESGMGGYHGREGFRTFSHYKSIVDKKTWLDQPMRYQPYKRINDKLIHFFLK